MAHLLAPPAQTAPFIVVIRISIIIGNVLDDYFPGIELLGNEKRAEVQKQIGKMAWKTYGLQQKAINILSI